MTLKRKVTRAATATAEEFLQSYHASIANVKEVEEDDETLDSEKRKIDIADWICQPRKPPSSNEDKEYKNKEEDVVATQASTEDNSSTNVYKKGR